MSKRLRVGDIVSQFTVVSTQVLVYGRPYYAARCNICGTVTFRSMGSVAVDRANPNKKCMCPGCTKTTKLRTYDISSGQYYGHFSHMCSMWKKDCESFSTAVSRRRSSKKDILTRERYDSPLCNDNYRLISREKRVGLFQEISKGPAWYQGAPASMVAATYGVSSIAFRVRRARGWSLEDAMFKPPEWSRGTKGSKGGWKKDKDPEVIGRKRKSGRTITSLAKEYGVTHFTMSKFIHNNCICAH